MPTHPHRRLRRIAILALVILAAMLVAAVLFESGQEPISYTLRAWLPILSVAGIPLIVLLVGLAFSPTRPVLALGVAYPIAALFLFARYISGEMEGNSDRQTNIMLMLMFFWFNTVWMLWLVAFVPTMVAMIVAGWRALAPSPVDAVAIVVWAVFLAAFGSRGMRKTVAAAQQVPYYHPSIMSNAIELLNECIWRYREMTARGAFPESIPDIERIPYRVYPKRAGSTSHERCAHAVRDTTERPYLVDYEPTNRDANGLPQGFRLMLSQKVRPGGRPRVTWYDEKNVRVDAVASTTGELDSIHVRPTMALGQLLIVRHLIDRHASRNGGRFPAAIVSKSSLAPEEREAPPPGILALRDIGNFTSATPAPTGSSSFGRNDYSFVYMPHRDGNGEVTGYTLTLMNPAYDNDQGWHPIPARTYHLDREGRIHAFGGLRPADDTDPLVTDDEMRFARQALQVEVEQMARDSASSAFQGASRAGGRAGTGAPPGPSP